MFAKDCIYQEKHNRNKQKQTLFKTISVNDKSKLKKKSIINEKQAVH